MKAILSSLSSQWHLIQSLILLNPSLGETLRGFASVWTLSQGEFLG